MIRITLIFLLLLSAPFSAAFAQSAAAVPENVLRLSLMPGWRMADGSHMAALRIQLKPGWKTYWRAPGDAGIPPQFNWRGSKNIAAVKFRWPRPKVSYANGMRSIVYKDEVIIPVQITPKHKNQPVSISGQAELGVCQEICVPVSVNFAAKVNAKNNTPDPVIRAALKKQPISASKAGVKSVTCTVEPISDGLRVTATVKMPSTGKGEIAVLEMTDQNIWVSEATTKRNGATLTAISDLVGPSNAPFMLDRSKLRITVIGANKAVDILGCTG